MVDGGEIKSSFQTKTLTHPNTLTETPLITFLALKSKVFLVIDMSNLSLVNPTIIRVFSKVIGATYKQTSRASFPTDYETGTVAVFVELNGFGTDAQVTLQSTVAEGSIKNIPIGFREEEI